MMKKRLFIELLILLFIVIITGVSYLIIQAYAPEYISGYIISKIENSIEGSEVNIEDIKITLSGNVKINGFSFNDKHSNIVTVDEITFNMDILRTIKNKMAVVNEVILNGADFDIRNYKVFEADKILYINFLPEINIFQQALAFSEDMKFDLKNIIFTESKGKIILNNNIISFDNLFFNMNFQSSRPDISGKGGIFFKENGFNIKAPVNFNYKNNNLEFSSKTGTARVHKEEFNYSALKFKGKLTAGRLNGNFIVDEISSRKRKIINSNFDFNYESNQVSLNGLLEKYEARLVLFENFNILKAEYDVKTRAVKADLKADFFNGEFSAELTPDTISINLKDVDFKKLNDYQKFTPSEVSGIIQSDFSFAHNFALFPFFSGAGEINIKEFNFSKSPALDELAAKTRVADLNSIENARLNIEMVFDTSGFIFVNKGVVDSENVLYIFNGKYPYSYELKDYDFNLRLGLGKKLTAEFKKNIALLQRYSVEYDNQKNLLLRFKVYGKAAEKLEYEWLNSPFQNIVKNIIPIIPTSRYNMRQEVEELLVNIKGIEE